MSIFGRLKFGTQKSGKQIYIFICFQQRTDADAATVGRRENEIVFFWKDIVHPNREKSTNCCGCWRFLLHRNHQYR